MSAATTSKHSGDSLNHDLHVKMSKKIAQLTKVIYVLNTRNDDHETVLEDITTKHKLELRQTVAEVNERVQEMETRLKNQSLNYNKIQELQDIVKSQDMILEKTKAEFVNYKNDVSRSNESRDGEHVQQLKELNDKISYFGTSYRELLDNYDVLQRKMDAEKIKSLEDQSNHYEKQISELKEQFSKKERHLQDLISGSHKEIEVELLKTQEEMKTALNIKEKTIIQYEDKIKELKNSFEKELSQSLEENKKLLEFELEEANAKIMDLQNKLADKNEYIQTLVAKHLIDLKDKDVSIEDSKKETELIRTDNKEKLKTISKYKEEVNNLKEVIINIERDLKSKKTELDNIRQINDNLAGEIEQKTKQLKELKNNLESSYKKMMNKDTELKEALYTIEIMSQEIKDNAHCPKSQSVDYEIEIQSLKRALEALGNERQQDKQALDRLRLDHDIELGDLQNRLNSDHTFDLDKVTKKLEKEWSMKEKSFKEEAQKLKEDSQFKVEEERNKASKIIEKIKTDLEQIKNDNNNKLKSKEKQISLLEASITEKDKEFKVLSSQYKNIKETVSSLKKDSARLTSSNTEKDLQIEKLTEDIRALQLSLDEQMLEKERLQKSTKMKVQEDMIEKYNQLSANLDKKWADTLRRETGRIRNDMLDNFAKEKESIIENVEKMKNQEILAIRKELENNKILHSTEIESYKESLSKIQSHLQQENEEIAKYDKEKIYLLEKKLESEKVSNMSELSKIKEELLKEMEVISQRYEKDKSQYVEDMEILLEASERDWTKKHEAIILKLKEEHEKIMNRRMDEVINEHNRQMNDQINEVHLQMTESQQGLLREYDDQVNNLHQKIHCLEDQIKLQMNNHRTEMEKSVSSKSKIDAKNNELEQSLQEILKENQFLKKQLDEFSEDFNRNQKEFVEKMRSNESELKHHYEQIIQANKIKYEEDSKSTFHDFNKAQSLYKEKIKELNLKLLEVEEKYDVRASRDEDLELIETLRAQLRTSEKEIERMNEEKKFFQLELINRETNFNKIFNASPNVGNNKTEYSTQTAIKTKKGSNEKIKAFQKLTPLPGSPFHDDPINPARPLPPSRKSIDAS